MGENLQNYEVVLTEKRYLCYYVEAESEQVALDEASTAWAEGDTGEELNVYGIAYEVDGRQSEDREIIDRVAYVMEQY